MDKIIFTHCQYDRCGLELPENNQRGMPRKYCNANHRVLSFLHKKADAEKALKDAYSPGDDVDEPEGGYG